MDLAVGESELYSDLMTAPLHKEIEKSRESSKCSLQWKKGEAGPT
jgi:hypothetical protein